MKSNSHLFHIYNIELTYKEECNTNIYIYVDRSNRNRIQSETSKHFSKWILTTKSYSNDILSEAPITFTLSTVDTQNSKNLLLKKTISDFVMERLSKEIITNEITIMAVFQINFILIKILMKYQPKKIRAFVSLFDNSDHLTPGTPSCYLVEDMFHENEDYLINEGKRIIYNNERQVNIYSFDIFISNYITLFKEDSNRLDYYNLTQEKITLYELLRQMGVTSSQEVISSYFTRKVIYSIIPNLYRNNV